MQERRNIETITSIKKKKGLYLINTASFSFSLSEAFYLEELLYVGKSLSNNDLIRLKHLEDLSLPLDYAHKVLSRSLLSVHLLKEKLLMKFPTLEDTNEIIYRLKKEGLLDDKIYAEAYKDSKEALLYGPRKIKDELIFLKGVNREIVNSLTFLEEETLLDKLFPIVDQKYMNLPYKKKVSKVQKYLIDRGFDFDLASQYAKRSKVNEEQIKKKLEEDYLKAERLYKRKYEGYELKQRIISSLLAKGYTMNMIKEILR